MDLLPISILLIQMATYKEVWPVKSSGGNREENYLRRIKTNEEISDITKIKRFSDQLDQ